MTSAVLQWILCVAVQCRCVCVFAIMSVFVSLLEGLGIANTHPAVWNEGGRERERSSVMCGKVLLTKEYHSAETSTWMRQAETYDLIDKRIQASQPAQLSRKKRGAAGAKTGECRNGPPSLLHPPSSCLLLWIRSPSLHLPFCHPPTLHVSLPPSLQQTWAQSATTVLRYSTSRELRLGGGSRGG